MRPLFRIGGLLTVVGVLTLSGCGGEPMYERRAVPTSARPPSSAPPSHAAASSATGTPTQAMPSRTPRASAAPTTPPAQTSTSNSAPSPSSTPSPSASAPRGEPTTLDTMGGPGSGPILIGGTRYPNSFAVSACTVFSTQPTYSFDLGKRYASLSGVIGQDDDSASRDAVLQLTIRGDGRPLAERTVRYGQRLPITVDVSGVSRLTLSFTEVSCGSDGAALAFGAARVS